jgi:hypothetical protein
LGECTTGGRIRQKPLCQLIRECCELLGDIREKSSKSLSTHQLTVNPYADDNRPQTADSVEKLACLRGFGEAAMRR